MPNSLAVSSSSPFIPTAGSLMGLNSRFSIKVRRTYSAPMRAVLVFVVIVVAFDLEDPALAGGPIRRWRCIGIGGGIGLCRLTISRLLCIGLRFVLACLGLPMTILRPPAGQIRHALA